MLEETFPLMAVSVVTTPHSSHLSANKYCKYMRQYLVIHLISIVCGIINVIYIPLREHVKTTSHMSRFFGESKYSKIPMSQNVTKCHETS